MTIYLDPNQVPAVLRAGYDGRKFKAVVGTEMTIPADAGLWEGGSREQYRGVNLETGQTALAPGQNTAPWDNGRENRTIKLAPGFAVVCHSMFCGKDMGLTFYVHPDNAAKLLPVAVTLTPTECLVLNATKSLKSSYGGRDRYSMAQSDYSLVQCLEGAAYPTREQWDAAKQSLAARGLLNKAGAITPAGRNAVA